jgi:arylsulfatase A-like enzyme
LERSGALDDTVIVFFGDNGYFFGEHALGPERRTGLRSRPRQARKIDRLRCALDGSLGF